MIIWATRREPSLNPAQNWASPVLQGPRGKLLYHVPPLESAGVTGLFEPLCARTGKPSLVLHPRGVTLDVHLQRRRIGPLLFELLVVDESGVLPTAEPAP